MRRVWKFVFCRTRMERILLLILPNGFREPNEGARRTACAARVGMD